MGKAWARSYQFWYRRRYNLAPTDPRFLDATFETILTDYYAWQFHEKPDGEEEFEDDGFDESLLDADEEWEDVPIAEGQE